MVDSLVQILGECPAEDRARVVAIKSAQIGTNEVVKGLIRVAEGGSHTPEVWIRKPWYNPHKERVQQEMWEHPLGDQLLAIEALGETRNRSALEYLKRLYTPSARPMDLGLQACGIETPIMDINYKYTNARGSLRDNLDYGTLLGQDIPPDNEAHRTIRLAIKRLEAALQPDYVAR